MTSSLIYMADDKSSSHIFLLWVVGKKTSHWTKCNFLTTIWDFYTHIRNCSTISTI